MFDRCTGGTAGYQGLEKSSLFDWVISSGSIGMSDRHCWPNSHCLQRKSHGRNEKEVWDADFAPRFAVSLAVLVAAIAVAMKAPRCVFEAGTAFVA